MGSFLSEAVFPDLEGRWKVEIHSNWPVVKAVVDAARSSSPVDVWEDTVIRT